MQCVDRAVSKHAVAIEGEGNELKRRQAAARRLYAAVLAKALTYGGAGRSGVIVYKSTKEWIITNCLVPPWLKLLHHGDVTGSNALQHVRALFVVGRPLASAEAVTRMTEALFGDYIAERDYRIRKKAGRIPIVPDAAGNNVVLVDIWEHPDPRAERMRRQVTEAALIQAVGRARAGLRGPGGALDIHLWTDVPLPELGPVEPVLWDEVAVGTRRADASDRRDLARKRAACGQGLSRTVLGKHPQAGPETRSDPVRVRPDQRGYIPY